jgi:CDP-archaeol synthase
MVDVAWTFLPVLGSPLAHAPVLRFDLLRGLKKPLDGGLEVGGSRVFGDNKTWRGALVMTAGSVAASVALRRADWYERRLPPAIREASAVGIGLRLGVASVVGELPNSFVKRRLGIAPGTQRRSATGALVSLIDQADWVPAAWLLLAPVHRLTARETARVAAIVTAIHLPINVVGYAIGARTSPL